MGRVYDVTVSDIAVTAVQDFITLTNAATTVIRLLRAEISQNSDYGDAQAEGLRVNLTRYATAGSGGSAVTPVKRAPNDPASIVTAARNNTTRGGTPATQAAWTFNVQAGLLWVPTPAEYVYVLPSAIIALEIPTAPADSLTMSGVLTFEEMA